MQWHTHICHQSQHSQTLGTDLIMAALVKILMARKVNISSCFLSDLVPKFDEASRMIAHAFGKPSYQRKFPYLTK